MKKKSTRKKEIEKWNNPNTWWIKNYKRRVARWERDQIIKRIIETFYQSTFFCHFPRMFHRFYRKWTSYCTRNMSCHISNQNLLRLQTIYVDLRRWLKSPNLDTNQQTKSLSKKISIYPKGLLKGQRDSPYEDIVCLNCRGSLSSFFLCFTIPWSWSCFKSWTILLLCSCN